MNHSMAVMTSSENMKWATPRSWFDYLDLEFDFTLDPCCEHETAKCAKHYTPQEDGLSQSWADERVFMNPPYGREIGPWMRKAYHECRDNGALVVCFVPARVDTEWWHQYAAKATEIRFPKGRVTFEGATAAAPFPVAVVVFRPRIGNPNAGGQRDGDSRYAEPPCSATDLLLAAILLGRFSPLAPHHAGAIRERLRELNDNKLREMVATGKWPNASAEVRRGAP